MATVAAILVLAHLLHRFIEKPVGPRLKRTMAAQSACFTALTRAGG
ncbi:hypothetical protein ACIP6P_27520 [Streptomyces sp. NPDC088729]